MLVIILKMTYEHVKRVGGEVGGKKIKQQHQKNIITLHTFETLLYTRLPGSHLQLLQNASLKFRSGDSIPA